MPVVTATTVAAAATTVAATTTTTIGAATTTTVAAAAPAATTAAALGLYHGDKGGRDKTLLTGLLKEGKRTAKGGETREETPRRPFLTAHARGRKDSLVT